MTIPIENIKWALQKRKKETKTYPNWPVAKDGRGTKKHNGVQTEKDKRDRRESQVGER